MTFSSTKSRDQHLVLIDGHALAFYCWFGSSGLSMLDDFFEELGDILDRLRPTHLLVTFDPPPPTFRHEIFPAYKANRPPVPEGFLEECEEIFGTLRILKIPFYMETGYEADDLLGTITRKSRDNGFNTTILTSDMDLLQLTSNDVRVEVFSQYWPRRTFTAESAKHHFGGISPDHIPDYKGLAGDRSDNLPGVKGIGDVAAKAVLVAKGSLEGIYESLDDIAELPIRGAKRISRLLSENEGEAYAMRELATIVDDVPMEVDFDEAISSEMGKRITAWQ